MISVEFLRQSKDDRITLVLNSKASSVRGLWAIMEDHNLDKAKRRLAEREGILQKNIEKYIGSWSKGG
ncbi:hypothetical protein KA005_44710, partial [bacterium]|nr:hypothetical protein [bacterium]